MFPFGSQTMSNGQSLSYLTDEEAVYQLAFNIQWHYALNITDESDSAKYLSLKTLWTFRQLITENGLETPIFNETTDKLSQVFQVDTNNQRIDSVHIKSNMRRLGRISIFTTCIHKFLVNLKADSDGQKVELKKPKEIPSDSLQKPSI
jgi:hypothetical protein